MMIRILFCLGLVTSVVNGLVAGREKRADRIKAHKETRSLVRADLDAKFKKARTIDSIAAAQQESRLLSRQALVSAWAQREKEKLDRHTAWGNFAHVYMAPDWDLSMQRFYGNHSTSLEYTYSYLSHGFNEAGDVVDSSMVRFGKNPTLSDISLASKLSLTDNATPAAGCEFLRDLAHTELPFQASLSTHECALGYQLGLFDNRLQVGVRVPLRQYVRSLRVVPELTSSVQAKLRGRDASEDSNDTAPYNGVFRSYYGLSISAMMADVAAQQNMIFREHLTHSAVGDISFFTTLNFFPWRLDRWTVSAELIVPAEKEVDNRYFYPVVPESRGFLSGKVSTGFMGRQTIVGAPHLMVSCQVYVPTSVKTRVPRIITAAGVAAFPENELFGQDLSFDPTRNINAPECTIADFASKTAVASMRPGFALDFRVGTVLHPFVSPLVECDVYYHFHMRGSDELRAGLSASDWYTKPLESVAYRAQHRLGVSLAYQPTSHVLLRAGINGVVAGRSMPLEVVGNASVGWSW